MRGREWRAYASATTAAGYVVQPCRAPLHRLRHALVITFTQRLLHDAPLRAGPRPCPAPTPDGHAARQRRRRRRARRRRAARGAIIAASSGATRHAARARCRRKELPT